jgi:tRNA dimethylallyltransferase
LNQPTVIVIVGPTAVGKSAAAIRLAQSLHTDIISADSRQCFTELNIGVAKPSPDELRAVHHYFINSHSILQEVNAALFEELALQWTEEIFRKQTSSAQAVPEGPTAIMVGGTGLYVKAFTEGLDEIPATRPDVREQIQAGYNTSGIDWLQQEIKIADPAFYEAGEIHNPQRLMRALEVTRSTGRSILSFRRHGKKERPFRIEKIGLHLPKEQLHQRIHDRVDQMMKQGLLEEVKGLLPYKKENALQTVGYRELFDYLDGISSLDEAIEKIKINTRHYAKRQMTWFRKDPSIRWIDAGEFLDDPLKKITES